MSRRSVSKSRCLLVGTTATAGLGLTVAVAVRALVADPARGAWAVEDAVTRLCLGGLVAALLWAWLQVVAGVTDAWRGSDHLGGGAVRRVTVVACGAALLGALAGPPTARADERPDSVGGAAAVGLAAVGLPLAHPPLDGPPLDGPPLDGLPLPERAEGAAPVPAGHDRVVVRAGDSLWAIAARRLHERAPDAEITEHWRRLHAANRAVVGPDPDLIRPGQVLRTTKEKS